MGFFKKSRMKLERDLTDTELRWKFSPALYTQRVRLVPLLQKEASGALLDVECGLFPFREYVNGIVDVYDGLDVERRSSDTKYIGDAQNMSDIESDRYDTVFSVCALEHMPKPWKALEEMRRVCKPGGKVILAVPHLSRYHEEPHDYYRFTGYGMAELAKETGLEVESIEPLGGLASFIGHQASTVILCVFWNIPLLKWAVF